MSWHVLKIWQNEIFCSVGRTKVLPPGAYWAMRFCLGNIGFRLGYRLEVSIVENDWGI